MRFSWLAVALIILLVELQSAYSGPAPSWDEAKVISEATGGRFKARKGKYFEKACNQSLDYEAEVVDLNNDGQPEVFTQIHGTCLGGMAGVYMDLFIKDKSGQWKPQFGFQGMYQILKTKNKGYP